MYLFLYQKIIAQVFKKHGWKHFSISRTATIRSKSSLALKASKVLAFCFFHDDIKIFMARLVARRARKSDEWQVK